MANRYWVGGSGTWSSTNTANWSTTSGGAGGASVPTAADSVFFTSATTYTVTFAASSTLACLDFTVSAGTVTFTQSGSTNLSISGNMSLIAATVMSANQTTMTFLGASKTLTTNNCSFQAPITIGSSTVVASVTLGSAFTSNGTFNVLNSTFSTSASNYSFTSAGYFQMEASTGNTVTVNLNASTLTVGYFKKFFSGGTLTVNAGTSTVAVYFELATGTYYNISLISTSSIFATPSIFSGAVTCNSLSTSLNAVGSVWQLQGNLTITNAFTHAPAQPYTRLTLMSDTTARRTISAGSVSISDVNFQGIVGAGAATWTGTRLGDAGNNSNITFPSPKTVYYSAATAGNWWANNWSTSSGGATSSANFPLPQDTAIIDDNSGTGSLAMNGVVVGNADFSNRTTALTLSGASYAFYICGDVTLNSNITVTSTYLVFLNGVSKTIYANSASISSAVYFYGPSTTVMGSNFTTSGSATQYYGTLSLSSYTFSCDNFSTSSTTTREINFGTGNITVTGSGAVWSNSTATNLTVSGTSAVYIVNPTSTATSITLSSSSTEANTINFYVTSGSYALTISASGRLRGLSFSSFTGSLATNAFTMYGDLTLGTGMTVTASANDITFAKTTGTQSITSNGVSLSRDITLNGVGGGIVLQDNCDMTGRIFTLTNGTLDLNGKSLTVTTFQTAAGTKNLTFNGGTLNCAGTTSTFNNAVAANFTTTAGTGTGQIVFTSASAKTFNAGGSTYNCNIVQGGAGALTISGSNTFYQLSNSAAPTTINITSGTTQTVTGLAFAGTAGNLVTFNAGTAGSRATISQASGTSNLRYTSIKDMVATGGAQFNAFTNAGSALSAGNVNSGNNLGWNYIPPGATFASFFQ